MDIFTIGHSNYSIERFVYMLRCYHINCVVDIRGIPYSRYNVQYNKEIIKKTLNDLGFTYIHMGREFSAQRDDKALYTKEGFADFEKVIYTKDFLNGVDRLKNGCNKGYKIVLMAAKQDPINCHRCILMGRYLRDNGVNVKHILDDLTIGTQEEMEEKILDKYYSERTQLTIDSLLGMELSREDMIKEAYKQGNKDIGYRVEKIGK